MPLGTEHAHDAGSIRAAAALVEWLDLPDDESVGFSWNGQAYLFEHPYEPDTLFYLVEDFCLTERPSEIDAAFEAGGWTAFDEDPWPQ